MTMTIRELADFYLNTYLRDKPSRSCAARLFKLHIPPLGAKPLDALKRVDVFMWHQEIGKRTPGSANEALKYLRSMYNRAVELGMFVGANPTNGVKRFRRQGRRVYIKNDEIPLFLRAIEASPLKLRTYLVLDILTASRPGETRKAQWNHFDFAADPVLWVKPTTKPGEYQPTPVPRQAIELLRQLPRRSPYVFPGHRLDQPWAECSVRKAWAAVRAPFHLQHVTVYDLRRTMASHLSHHNTALPVIQGALGHHSLTATSVYARMNVTAVAAALQEQADRWFKPLPPASGEELLDKLLTKVRAKLLTETDTLQLLRRQMENA